MERQQDTSQEEGTKGLPCPAEEGRGRHVGTQALAAGRVKGSDPVDEEKMSYCLQSIHAVLA